MATTYQLWELSAGNLIGAYETEAEALRDVLAAIRRDGVERIDTIALDYDDPDGQTFGIAEGPLLAERALAAAEATA